MESFDPEGVGVDGASSLRARPCVGEGPSLAAWGTRSADTYVIARPFTELSVLQRSDPFSKLDGPQEEIVYV